MPASDVVTFQTLAAIGTPLGSAILLGWWLSGRFRKVETSASVRINALEAATSLKIEGLAKISRDQLQAHEVRDQERHQENIDRFETMADRAHDRHDDNQKRFEALSVSLAKLGANGGR